MYYNKKDFGIMCSDDEISLSFEVHSAYWNNETVLMNFGSLVVEVWHM